MTTATERWVDEEFGDVCFGDKRLEKRFRSIVTDLGRRCGKTLASSFDSWSKIKGSYRFFANSRVSVSAMLAPHINRTIQRIRTHDIVLLAQDTTYFDFTSRKKTEGLDLTNRSKLGKHTKGLMLHNTLAVTPCGLPLGLLDQRFIDRKQLFGKNAAEKKQIRHCNEAIDGKESRRWIDIIRLCHERMDFGTCRTVHVCDREGDIYELFRDSQLLGENVLIRAARNRAIDKTKRREAPTQWLFDKFQSRRAQARTTIRIQVNGRKKYRDAILSITYLPISMPPPPNKTAPKDGAKLPMVQLNAIMATEKQRDNADKIHWVLLTNLPIEDSEAAIEKVSWYAKRWQIEIFHKVLKSGCAVEKAQLEKAQRLKNYIVLKSLVAWRLMWLSNLKEQNGERPCDEVLERIEWVLLSRKMNKSSKAPKEVPTVKQAFIWIAKLGGYIARPSDPDPGIISLWRGWERLSDLVDDYRDICGSS